MVLTKIVGALLVSIKVVFKRRRKVLTTHPVGGKNTSKPIKSKRKNDKR